MRPRPAHAPGGRQFRLGPLPAPRKDRGHGGSVGIAGRGNALTQGAPVDDRAAIFDQREPGRLHQPRSAASRFSSYNASSASRGVSWSGSSASTASASGSSAGSGSRPGEQRQLIQPGGNAAGRVTPGFELGEHRLGAGNRPLAAGRPAARRQCRSCGRRRPRRLRAAAPVRPSTRAPGHDAATGCRAGRRAASAHDNGSRTGSGLDLVVHRLDHRPGNRQPVISRCAAPDLVEDDQAARRRLGKDRRRLDHLDHEG